MKYFVFLIFFLGCSQSDWDSGARAQKQFQEESSADRVKSTRNQIPRLGTPTTNQAQPL